VQPGQNHHAPIQSATEAMITITLQGDTVDWAIRAAMASNGFKLHFSKTILADQL
jgi:hypothetical protein